MLRSNSERRDSGQPGASTPDKSVTFGATTIQSGSSKPRINHKRKSSAAKPKVTFKTQTSSSQADQRSRTAAKHTSQIPSNITPVTRRHKAFASLFVSLLATTPVAIEEDAVDERTVKSANAASTTPLPPKPEPTGTVRSAEIRKTRWKRFRYEMSLKLNGGSKGKQRQKELNAEAMELADMHARKMEEERQQARGS